MRLRTIIHWGAILLLIVVQTFVLNHIALFRLATPMLYLFSIMLFPIATPSWRLTLYGALIGFVTDWLSGTPGLHMAAMTLIGCVRNSLLRPFIDAETDLMDLPNRSANGVGIFLFLAEVTLLHHIVLFGLDGLRAFDWLYFAQRTGSSALFTYILLIILERLSLSSTQPSNRNHGVRE